MLKSRVCNRPPSTFNESKAGEGGEWSDFPYPTLPFPMGQPAVVGPHQVVAAKNTEFVSVSVLLFYKLSLAFVFLVVTASVN